MIRRWLTHAILASGLAVTAPGVVGAVVLAPQVEVIVRKATPETASVGWLGFRSTVQVLVDEAGARLTGSSLQVSEVFADGPADRSGLRPGDVLVAFNGAALAVDRFQSLAQRLRPGDPVVFTVLRDNRQIELALTAEPRPGLDVMVPRQLQRALDASRTTFVARLDSVRPRITSRPDFQGLELHRIRADSLQTVRVVSDGGLPVIEIHTPDGVFEWVGPGAPGPSSAPQAFSAWVYRSGPGEARADVSIAVPDRRGVGRTSLAPSVVVPPIGRAAYGAAPTAPSIAVRPLAPYVAGLNRVAGAQFTTLSGELATYFQVGRGLLVTDVADRTPASDAGLAPGDVIVEAGGRPVASIDGFRAALSVRDGPLVLGLVRRGQRIEVRLVN
jgi:S1-C subfamily serine protease